MDQITVVDEDGEPIDPELLVVPPPPDETDETDETEQDDEAGAAE